MVYLFVDVDFWPKDQFRQNTFGDESCRGLTMKAMSTY